MAWITHGKHYPFSEVELHRRAGLDTTIWLRFGDCDASVCLDLIEARLLRDELSIRLAEAGEAEDAEPAGAVA